MPPTDPPESDAKRQRIMEAAEALFTSRRVHEVTTDEIARHAHVGKGTIYRYFRDKDDLFFQTATRGFEQLCEHVVEQDDVALAFECRLNQACQRISSFFRQRRELIRMMQTEEGRMPWCKGDLRKDWQARRQKLIDAVAQILESGVGQGQVRPGLPPRVLAGMLLGMLRTRARDLADGPDPQPSVEVVVDLFLHGTAPRDAEADEAKTGVSV